MNRIEFRAFLASLDLSSRTAEESFRFRMIELLDTTPDCFLRTSFPGHFTGSAMVLNADRSRVLLHHHRKLDRWLQFGGHCDGDEDVQRVAMREAQEESGIEGLLPLTKEPVDLDIHQIPAHRNEPVHYHYDVRYLLVAPPNAVAALSDESKALRWFTQKEVLALQLDDGLRRLFRKVGVME